MTVREWVALVFLSACAACGAGKPTGTSSTLQRTTSLQAPGLADAVNDDRPVRAGERGSGKGITVGEVTFDLESDPGFASYEAVIRDYVRRSGARRASDLCVVGFVHTDQSRSAWVHWAQGGKVILWEGGDEVLERSRRLLDLKTDVVATEDDLHGSTYLVTRTWVSELAVTCKRAGRIVHVPGREHAGR